jgi:hypothetical protein
MAADPSADFGCVAVTAVVEPAILIAAAWRLAFGFGVPEQHQTAHIASRFGFRALINVQTIDSGQGDKREIDP